MNHNINLESIKAVIFDLDDTLYNARSAYSGALKSIGFPESETIFKNARQYIKDNLPQGYPSARNRILYFKTLLEQRGQWTPNDNLKLMKNYEEALIDEILKQSPFLSSLFEELKKLSFFIPLAILTNETTRTQLLKLNCLDPHNRCFKFMLTSEEIGEEKPHHKGFEECLSRLNLNASQCLMIGDSLEADIKPALELGMQALHTQEFGQLDTPEKGIVSIKKLTPFVKELAEFKKEKSNEIHV